LDGIHLAPPNYLLPFHSGGDASNDGKSYGIHPYCDLPSGTQFTVTAHSPISTTVRLIPSNRLHTIPHNLDTRLNIAWFSKTWSEADRKRAPFYLEADTLLWGLAKCRFWALSSPFPLYASSDHLPLKWIRKCEKGPVSEFTIEQLSDIQWIHSYIPGPDNSLFDALSRYPLLGPRVLAPVGLSDAVSQLLDSLPDSLRNARLTRVFGNRITTFEHVARGKPEPDVFIEAARRAGYAPEDCIVVEDSVTGVTAAHRAGCHVLGFTGTHPHPDEQGTKLLKAGAASVFSHMGQLPRLVSERIL
jgi:hypothetical protein